jgi:hypothetical protein
MENAVLLATIGALAHQGRALILSTPGSREESVSKFRTTKWASSPSKEVIATISFQCPPETPIGGCLATAADSTMHHMSETTLVARMRRGEAAFDSLYRVHAEKLVRTVQRITRNHEDAEDAAQDSFLRAFTHFDSGRSECQPCGLHVSPEGNSQAVRYGVDAAVAHHGGDTEKYLREVDRLGAPLLMHLAEEDEFISKSAQAEIKAALISMSFRG